MSVRLIVNDSIVFAISLLSRPSPSVLVKFAARIWLTVHVPVVLSVIVQLK